METKQSGTDGTQPTPRCSGGWLFPALLAIGLLGLLLITRWTPSQPPLRLTVSPDTWVPTPQPTGETVSLTLDFGNGAKKEFAALPWQGEMTVADLLEQARKFRPGIEFTQVGQGESGFLTALDGLANEGGEGRNWIYRVDGRHANVSFCLEKIEPGTHVLWTFTDEQYNGEPDATAP